MRKRICYIVVIILTTFMILSGGAAVMGAGGSGNHPGGEAAGNNLSFPVIWSDGLIKDLRGTPGEENEVLSGAMWYWWGTKEDGDPESCLADPDDTEYCDDGNDVTFGEAPCYDRGDPDCKAVYPQQDSNNQWQAESYSPVYYDPVSQVWVNDGGQVNVSWIDWGDNLESVDWYTRSKVRTEVVLIKDLETPMREYGMRHLDGWGITELWGLDTTDGVVWDPDHNDVEDPDDDGDYDDTDYSSDPVILDGYQATIYSGCARLTIQKLLVPREDINDQNLTWDPSSGEWIDNEIDPTNYLYDETLLNKTVWDGGDGPGYYSAEINVKGKVIYGYTWDLKALNHGAGDYRITFSLDETNYCTGDGDPPPLNTFIDGDTKILEPVEEAASLEEEPGGGATPVIDPGNNLTYIDVRILERSGGKPKKIK